MTSRSHRFISLLILASLGWPLMARDLTLPDAEALLVRNNRELLAARRAVDSADAQGVIAGARPNATLSLNTSGISGQSNLSSGPFSQARADSVLRIDQPFERGDKRDLRIGAASVLQRAARNDALDVLRQQLAQVRGGYYDLKQAQERAAVLAETAQLFAGTLAAAQVRLRAGDLASADVAKVQVDYERSQNDARAARADLARAQLALGYLLGLETEASDLKAADTWPAASRPEPGELERAVDARPDVIAALARVEAADRLRDLARAQRTRDITVGAQVERFPGSAPVNTVGLGVALPVFTGYDFAGEIQKAEVDRYAAVDALAKTRALATNELRRAGGDLDAAAERVERFDTSLLEAANRSAQAAEFAFKRGAISVLEVLDGRRTLRAVRLEELAARGDYARALAAWRAAQTSAATLEGK
ncbi:MAG TPA: TolC family protein [Burkholderiales bacterium]